MFQYYGSHSYFAFLIYAFCVFFLFLFVSCFVLFCFFSMPFSQLVLF